MTPRFSAFATAAGVAGTLGLSVVVAKRFLYASPYAATATVVTGDGDQVELTKNRDTTLPGTYRLARGDDTVTVGAIRTTTGTSVLREASPAAAAGEWAWDALMADSVPAASEVADTHVIHVHGQSLGPRQTVRGISVWTGLGASSEVLDVEGFPLRALDPATAGLIESRVRAARQQGAKRVILQGWSAGALACSVAAGRTPVDAIVAISPLLSVRTALRAAVAGFHLPRAIGSVSYRLLTTAGLSRLAGTVAPLTATKWVVTPGTPVLVLHSDADSLVAEADVEQLQQSDEVSVVTFDTAPHTLEWNESPTKWDQAIKTFAGANSLAR